MPHIVIPSLMPLNFPPSIAIAMSLIAGIICEQYNIELPYCLIVATILSCTIAIIYRTSNLMITLSILAAPIFFIGILQLKNQKAAHEYAYAAISNKKLKIRAAIESLQKEEDSRLKYSITARIENVEMDAIQRPDILTNRLLIIHTNNIGLARVGDTILFNAQDIKKPKAETLLHYLIRENIIGYIFSEKFDYKILKRPYYSANRWIFEKKENLISSTKSKMSVQAHAFFSSLFLGNRAIHKKYYQELKKSFQSWGISHYLARSGLHLTTVISAWNYILAYMPLGLEIKYLIIAMLVLVYSIFSWASISFFRALLFFIISLTLRLLHYRISPLNNVTLVTFIVLAYNPILLFFLDFQLSFGITFLLSLLTDINERKILK